MGSHLETDSPTQGGPLTPARALLQPVLAHLPRGRQIWKEVSSAQLRRGSAQRLPPDAGRGASPLHLEEGAEVSLPGGPRLHLEILPMFSKVLQASCLQTTSDQNRCVV